MASSQSKRGSRIGLLGDGDYRVFLAIFKSYFPRYKYKYGIIFVLIAVASGATAAAPWLVRDVVNDFFVKRDGTFLVPIFLLIVGLFVAKGAATYWQSVLSARIANDMVARTQERIFAHILAQRVRFFERYGSDDLTMRVNSGAGSIGTILNQVVLNGARDAATVLSLAAVMIAQDATLTLLSVTVAPVIFLGLTRLLKRIKELMHQELVSISQLNKHVREIVQGAKVIKSYNLEPVIKAEVDDAIQRIKDRANRVSALQVAPVPLLDTAGGVGVGLTILYAGWRSVYGGYDPGTFMSFVTALMLALEPARRLSQLRLALKASLVGVHLVDELLSDHQPDDDLAHGKIPAAQAVPETAPAGMAISLREVRFCYQDGVDVLRGLSLEVRAGEMLALVGPSGAGKSTIFSLLLRFHRHRAGEILIDGRAIETIPLRDLRDRIAYVGQSNFIFSGSIADNLTLRRPGVPQEKIEAACRAVGLSDYIEALPDRYDTPVGELGSLISGGQSQRLNIARAILKDAPILLFDEVTSALDADNEELVRSYMHAQAGKKTVLVIAHRISTIRQADRIALIEDGVLKAFGTHQELIHGNDYYERAAALQLIA